jgi:hypothetical protein
VGELGGGAGCRVDVSSRCILRHVYPAVALFSLLTLVMMLQRHGSTAGHVAQLDDIISLDASGC